MKKIITLLVATLLLALGLTACGSAQGAGTTSENDTQKATAGSTGSGKDTIRIVTTIFPEYDWVKNILGDTPEHVELTMLLDNGVDLHSYQPTADDILKVSTCDLFIYVGGESDKWVQDALKEATNKDMVVLNLMEIMGDKAKEEEIVEGMEHDHDHDHEDGDHDHEDADHDHEDADHDHEDADHDHEDADHDHDEDEKEYDEHVWLSLKNTMYLCDAITDALKKVDQAHADLYQKNADAYKKELSALDAEYAAAVDAARVKTLLFGDRFPFRYLTDDYGLTYYAAFVGCSAETEASFETVIFLAEKTDELGLSTILTIEGTDHKLAETIKKNTKTKDQQLLSLNSMQSTNSKDVEAGVSYLSIMKENLEVLKEALK